ncbi:MAG: PorT family protein [Paludibacteraceae bacterium]|nr:PorT family protein [Paludibacteraceae bacterium]
MKNFKQYILLLVLCAAFMMPGRAQNNPYVDDRVIHFGFQLGLNLMTFGVTDSEEPIVNPLTGETEIYHARVSNLLPGFNVGFITDVRLSRHLSLRLTPGMQFSSRTLSYKTESGRPVTGSLGNGAKTDVLSIPVYIPLYLKWAAEREGNYRPYVIGGGGVMFNVSRDREKPILLKPMDYFCEVGAGVDLYFRWFKFCPEITYRIGFANQLAPIDGRMELAPQDLFYTTALKRLLNRQLVITFNFE